MTDDQQHDDQTDETTEERAAQEPQHDYPFVCFGAMELAWGIPRQALAPFVDHAPTLRKRPGPDETPDIDFGPGHRT